MGSDRVRVGVVSYLNTEPLIYGLAEDAPEVELIRDVPSRLAEQLAAGRLDVAIVSSIEYFRHPGYRIASDACLASRGEVLSVKLFSRVRPERIGRLALDEGSLTASALVQVLLAERYGVRPQVSVFPLDLCTQAMPAELDAVLLIGDRCMRVPPHSFPFELDLGRLWTQWTDLPFVYAVWTCRPGARLGGVVAALERARDRGVANLERIARQAGPPRGLDAALCYDYLSRHMLYRLGVPERQGLKRFYDEAVRLGLAPPGRAIEFYGD